MRQSWRRRLSGYPRGRDCRKGGGARELWRGIAARLAAEGPSLEGALQSRLWPRPPPPQWVPQRGQEVVEVRRPSASGPGPGWRPQVVAGGLVRNRQFTTRKRAAHAALRSDWRVLSAQHSRSVRAEAGAKSTVEEWSRGWGVFSNLKMRIPGPYRSARFSESVWCPWISVFKELLQVRQVLMPVVVGPHLKQHSSSLLSHLLQLTLTFKPDTQPCLICGQES